MAVGVAVVFAAVLISFLAYTQQMAGVLRRDAVVFGRLYALTFQAAGARNPEQEARLTGEMLFSVLGELDRLRIPAVLTDTAGVPQGTTNLPFEADVDDPADLRRIRRYVQELDRQIPPLRFEGLNLEVHFGEPLFLRRLKWVPWLQAALLLAVVGGGAWLIVTSFRSERERIWSAMARESAHQMGTPLSSLVGWLETLENRGVEAGSGRVDEVDVVDEMKADVRRLQKVTRRFELIGRAPRLEPVSVRRIVERLRRYFSVRLPTLGREVRLEIEIPADAPPVRGNETLLEWALENLIKNSLDALAGRDGVVGVAYEDEVGKRAVFRVYDSGPGVPASVRKNLFEIGVTTKERGWGVGLSLTRRIIEEMHAGEIQLENTTNGASFRIALPIARSEEAAAEAALGAGGGSEETARRGTGA